MDDRIARISALASVSISVKPRCGGTVWVEFAWHISPRPRAANSGV